MIKLEYNLTELREQEERLKFENFTNEIAMEIGLLIIKNAKKMNKSIIVDIRKANHQVFHYAMEGTTPDNNWWIIRKNNVVNRFSKSSLFIGIKLKLEEKSIEEKYLIDSKDYAPFGGAFPINVEGVGIIGTITVSGMKQIEDHNIIIETLSQYLNK
ncbi:heme-degrading domain-containing protein [Clostridium sediminicola]|uniref:heme-degrading domain-containing protein n=1 Tax=Clostridium sediminicola TaxID=3114879 RepID=UPI0031F1CE72